MDHSVRRVYRLRDHRDGPMVRPLRDRKRRKGRRVPRTAAQVGVALGLELRCARIEPKDFLRLDLEVEYLELGLGLEGLEGLEELEDPKRG